MDAVANILKELNRDRLEQLLNKIERLVDAAMPLSVTPPDFHQTLAFRWEHEQLKPVIRPHLFNLNNLVGIDEIKEDVLRNTRQFLAGAPANNVLLWGERGCGKSSLVKGLLREFAADGLRMIELKRWEIMSLPRLFPLLPSRPFTFILFCDDLSFDEGETDFRALKTFLDGDIEERPDNVLIYATSNRRHLMPERFADNSGEQEIHPEEAVGEKLALSDRFGLSLGFMPLDQDEYLAIVRHVAAIRGIAIPPEELELQARQWALFTGRRSGRSACQFADDLAGRLCLAQAGEYHL